MQPNIGNPSDITLKNTDFALNPRDFVHRCALATGMDKDLDIIDETRLIQAMLNGTPRLKILRAMETLACAGSYLSDRTSGEGIINNPRQYMRVEDVAAILPPGNAEFVASASELLCGRTPSEAEKLYFDYQLRSGSTSKEEVIGYFVNVATAYDTRTPVLEEVLRPDVQKTAPIDSVYGEVQAVDLREQDLRFHQNYTVRVF